MGALVTIVLTYPVQVCDKKDPSHVRGVDGLS